MEYFVLYHKFIQLFEHELCIFQYGLPDLKCSEEDCLADFVLQRDTRMKYSGACSLEFQSVMQILTKCMLRWDTKTQSSKGKGILSTVLAFSGADEEQGRTTLHQHWQIWVQELHQTYEIVYLTQMLLKEKLHKKYFANILTMLSVQVMDQI